MKDSYNVSKEEYEQISKWLLGNQEAIQFVIAINEAVKIADDFVDKKIEINSKDMTRLLHLLLVDIPSNNFFMQCRGWISPFLSTTLQLWNASNEWKLSDCKKTKMFACTYKELYHFLIPHIASLIGGYEHTQKVVLEGQKECLSNCNLKEMENLLGSN